MVNPMLSRASVRRFTPEPVSDDAVTALLTAAMQAPSAGNQQPWRFYVVKDAEKRSLLSLASPYAHPAAGAPVVLVLAGDTAHMRFPENWQMDLSAAAENILLAATMEGLGGVWMSIAPQEERMARVISALGLPANVLPFCLIAIGHPREMPQVKLRYDDARVTWI